MDYSNLEAICRFCLTNRTKGFGVNSFQIDENMQKTFFEFTNSKLIITPSRPKLICLDCRNKFDYSVFFRNMIVESQIRLNQILPQETPEPCLITIKQEVSFIDESSIKLEPEDESEVAPFSPDPVSDEPQFIPEPQTKKPRNEMTPRKSSRSVINRSYNENSPERVDETLPRKRGRPKKSAIAQKNLKNQITSTPSEVLKVEIKEGSRESSPGFFPGFDDNPTAESSDDDDFKTPKLELDVFMPDVKKLAKPPIFATCTICPAVKKVRLQDEDDVKIHNEYVHEDIENPFLGPYKCKTCGKEMTSEVKIRKHVRLFHVFGNEKLCTTCGKKFYDRRAFYCHIDKNHGIRNVTCPVEGCGKMFNGKMNLGKHMKTHLPDGQRKVHICDRCGSRYINKDNIKLHLTKCDGRTFKDHTLVKPRRKLNRLKCYLNLGFTPPEINF